MASREVMLDERVERFRDLAPEVVMSRLRVMLIGCGALGSWCAEILARIGVKRFELWDFDTVELANVGVQVYTAKDVGKLKAEALAERLDAIAEDVRCERHVEEPYDEGTGIKEGTHVVIAAVDNYVARAALWSNMREGVMMARGAPKLYLDARMGAQYFEIWASSTGKDRGRKFSAAEYGAALAGLEGMEMPCGPTSTPYASAMCAALMANTVRKWGMGEEFPVHMTVDVPTMDVMKFAPIAVKGGTRDKAAGVRGEAGKHGSASADKSTRKATRSSGKSRATVAARAVGTHR